MINWIACACVLSLYTFIYLPSTFADVTSCMNHLWTLWKDKYRRWLLQLKMLLARMWYCLANI